MNNDAHQHGGLDGHQVTHCSRLAAENNVPASSRAAALTCSLSRVRTQIFVSAAAEEAGVEVRTAGNRTRRRRLNKLSCADWLPHDRGFVSGLPRSKWRASVRGPAHNRQGGFPTVVLSPVVRTSGSSVVDLLWWA